MLEHQLQWVAFYTAPRAEKKIAKKLSEEGFEIYLPLQRKLHQWHDRKKWVETPLFRSYIFAKIGKQQLYIIQNTQGISKPISFGGMIAIIPDEQIEAIKRMVASDQELCVRAVSSMKKGSKVIVKSGYFQNMHGILIKDSKDGNFAVCIHAISAEILVTIESHLLEPIFTTEEN